MRDTEARCNGWLRDTGHGLLLSTHWSHRMIDVDESVVQGRLVPRWELGGPEKGGCRSSKVIDDRLICARADDLVVESRSLSSGDVLWTYEAPGQVQDIIERQGRLLLQSGDYRLARDVSVVDFRTGAPLFREPVLQDAKFAVRSFDGQRIVLGARPPDGHRCTGEIVRTLTPAGNRLVAQDVCGEAERHPARESTDLRRGWKGDEASLHFTSTWDGTWVEGTGHGGNWTSFTRKDTLQLGEVHEAPGVLVLERLSRGLATLECLDSANGRPRWLYVYIPYRRGSREWDDARRSPPRGTVPSDVPVSTDVRAAKAAERLSRLPYPAPVTFDPVPAEGAATTTVPVRP